MIENTLQQFWRYPSFRSNQKQIITSVLDGKDVIAVLATGGGKSICYQLPTVHTKGICVVVSPLIALIQDQIEELSKRNIKALTIPSGSSSNDIIRILDNLKFGGYSFLYLSPERLQSRIVQEKLRAITVNLIAVDEAHCISEWGHDFRPSYRNISALREICPNANVIALTGTATKKVIRDISVNLNLNSPSLFKDSLIQNHIEYRILDTADKYGKLFRILQKEIGSSIIYTNSRIGSEELSRTLHSKGIKSTFYHGGLTPSEKKKNFKIWKTNQCPNMVATSAFGMGINKPDVRCIIHFNLPSSMEAYIQQVGRAGRDGKKAFGIVFKNENDIQLQNKILNQSLPSIKEIKNLYQKLFQYFSISKGEVSEDYHYLNPEAFYNQYSIDSKKGRTIFQLLQNNGIIEFDSNRYEKSSLQFITDSKIVQNYTIRNIYIKGFIASLLRLYTGLYKQRVYINEFEIAKKNAIDVSEVFRHLEQLNKDKIIKFQRNLEGVKIRFNHPREDDYTINSIAKNVKKYIHQKQLKSSEFNHFISNNSVCRVIQIGHYFDEKIENECQKCDVCNSKNKQFETKISQFILMLLNENKSLSSAELCAKIEAEEAAILIHLQDLIASQKITLTSSNKYQLNEQ